MHLDPHFPPAAPTNTPDPDEEVIMITRRMWNHLVNRMSRFESNIETLEEQDQTLRNRHAALEREYYEQAAASHKVAHAEPKIPDPPAFSGNRKELLPFLAKCQLKFEGQPSRFPTKRSKILYTGSRLEGPAFQWFQPLLAQYPAGSTTIPPELESFVTFRAALTTLYSDPNLETTAVREIRSLHQTGSAAEYAAKFESKRQYMHWNDEALRDQFYLNLKEELKDEIAPIGRPTTYVEMKTLAIRLDARLYERRLERIGMSTHSNKTAARPSTRFSPGTTPATASLTPAPSTMSQNPTPAQAGPGLRVPSHTADGTVPMELGASGLWQLTQAERDRRRQLGLCGYCGEKGHSTTTCPVAPPGGPKYLRGNRPMPQFNRQIMNVELTNETDASESEKGHTQE